MRYFLACFALTSALLIIALAQKASWKEEATPEVPDIPPAMVEGVVYRKIRIAGFAEGSLFVHSDLGSELRVMSMGSDLVRAANDGERLWFWIRPYDRNNFYSCSVADADEAGIMPALRPVFALISSGLYFNIRPHVDDGEESIVDGERRVVVRFSGGSMRSLSYLGEDGEEVSVSFLSHQVVGGAVLPRRIRVSIMGGPTVNVDMGVAELNPEETPDTRPPAGKSEIKLP